MLQNRDKVYFENRVNHNQLVRVYSTFQYINTYIVYGFGGEY